MQHGKVTGRLSMLVVLLAACIQWLPAQTNKLHYQHKAEKLSKVAEDFGKKFNVQLAYVNADLAAIEVPAGNFEAATVNELLNKMLAAAGFSATANGSNFVIKKSPAGPVHKALGIMVLQGTIMEKGIPVEGAVVQIKQDGLKNLTAITNDKGFFSKSIPQVEGIVEVNAVGFYGVKRKFGASEKEVLNIELSKDVKEIDEVVVTALGIKRAERSLGYSAQVVSGDQLTTAISGNWTDALSGKVPGLNLIRSNSGPAGSNRIVLRGENNLSGADEALIVVDGVVINNGSGKRTANQSDLTYGTGSDNMPADYGSGMNDLNPEDIETMTVLKGPGAAALYGQRAANGAIVITTKSGSVTKKKKMGISFNSNANLEAPNRWPDLQYEYGQGLGGANYYSFGSTADGGSTSGTSSAYGPRFEGQQFFQYDPVTQTTGKTRTPWVPYKNQIRDFFNTGSTITNTLSVDGSTDKTSARFSFTNVSNKWIIPNTGYKRNSISMSLNSKVSDKLAINSKIIYNNRTSDNLPGAGYGNQSLMYWFIFWQPNANLDWIRNYWANGQENYNIQYPYSSYPANPFAVVEQYLNSTNRHSLTGNISANYTFNKELSLLVRTSMDLSYDERAQKRPYDAGSKLTKGSYRTQNMFSQETTTDFLLKYNKQINKDFTISGTAGGSTLRNHYNKDEIRADSLVRPGLYTFANAAGPLLAMPEKSEYAINSFYGLVTMNYKNYLYADFTGRQDWNSVLATAQRTDNAGFFYSSANFSLVASDLLKLPAVFNYMKFRLSFAGVGSGGTKPYQTGITFESPGGNWDGGALQNPSTLNNPNLRPLKTVSYEAGTEIKMLHNRLGLDLTVYRGTTSDQILSRVIDRASGYGRQMINLGKVSNKGIEISITTMPVMAKNFSWKSIVNFSANQNRIDELADSSVVLRTGPVGGGQIVAKVGGGMGDVYGRGYVRAPDGQVVYDANTGVAMIDDNVKYLGTTTPKWKTSFINDFNYKRFTLHVLFDAQFGAVAHSLMNYKLAEQGKTAITLPGRYNGIIGNGVVKDGEKNYKKNTTIATDVDAYYRSHYGADNAEGSTFRTDFIKFREANLTYNFNPKLLEKIGLSRASLGVYGRNLFIWSPWPMFDPEFGTLSGTDIVQGFEIGQFPSTRSYGFNLVLGL
ncbi:TonB-linked SusC/RagA family outer membrane protein [Filimonas zeae]|uniref:SusC/RagA family TonB-linked outer membrane protein n=1 Tax=Filimonas zeae TaxID=1737353 RepID=A0A917MVK3_9BACT|nr:SusC/RagA family TonB-linked outer membrane protein [Filimonas zeae]MDR6338853.1 TonB-linked SusC/RagA family outer membrane protein [Filimonas zeae]GGH66286.1 SusC/RagA family TonB-linked outer membrane protein [Filimonas zeae]